MHEEKFCTLNFTGNSAIAREFSTWDIEDNYNPPPHTKNTHFVYRKIQALAGYMADLTEVTRKLGIQITSLAMLYR